MHTTDDRVITTADGHQLRDGDAAFNYYDMRRGHIDGVDARPQPDTMAGQDSSTPVDEWSNYWFDFMHDDGTVTSLDGSRICSLEHARRQGWLPAADTADEAEVLTYADRNRPSLVDAVGSAV